jgi:hypothetical protein
MIFSYVHLFLIDIIIICPDLSPLLQHLYLDQAGLGLMLLEDNQDIVFTTHFLFSFYLLQ